MTDKEKPSFFESLEQSETAAESVPATKPDLDFSFFDEPQSPALSPAPESDGTQGLELSFFDEPVSSASVASGNGTDEREESSFFSGSSDSSPFQVEQNTVDSAFSFLEDAAPSKPSEPTEQTARDGKIFSFDEEAREESVPVSPLISPAIEEETTGQDVVPQKPEHLRFTCVKCSEGVQVRFPETPLDRSTETCRHCSAQLVVVRETSAHRACRRAGELYCTGCGGRLAHHVHCPVCGRFCPDYYLVEDPREAQRKARANRSNNFRIALANLKSSLTRHKDSRSEELHHLQQAHATGKAGVAPSGRKRLVLLATMLVLLIAVGAAAFLFFRHKQEQQYVAAYVKAVYVLHTGTETVLAAMTKTAADWKAATDGGRGYAPKADSDTGIRLAKINSEASKLLQQLQQEIPAKYEKAHGNLLALNREFTSLQAVVTSPPPTLDQLNRRIEAADKAVKQRTQELKTGLTEEMSAELESARKRYRSLATF